MGEHRITMGGYEWSIGKSEWFSVAEGETKNLDDMYLVPFVLEMSARFLDEEGNPVPDVTYSVGAQDYYNPVSSKKSDLEGMVFLSNLPDTEISIGYYRHGYQRSRWEGFAGSHIEIVLKR